MDLSRLTSKLVHDLLENPAVPSSGVIPLDHVDGDTTMRGSISWGLRRSTHHLDPEARAVWEPIAWQMEHERKRYTQVRIADNHGVSTKTVYRYGKWLRELYPERFE
jgi:hypothetical protein